MTKTHTRRGDNSLMLCINIVSLQIFPYTVRSRVEGNMFRGTYLKRHIRNQRSGEG